MVKNNSAEQVQLQEARSENLVVQKKIAAIRGGKVMAFVGKAIEDGGEMVDAAVEASEIHSQGGDVSEPLRRVGKSAGAILEGAGRVASDSWEKLKENVRQGEWGQSVRWWLLDHGSTAAFDNRIAKRDRKLQNIEDKKQREARQFDELHEKFKSGEMNEMDIERNKREHLTEFDERLEKERAKQEADKKEREDHLKEVQQLKNRINDRITQGVNKVKLESNYDFNKNRQGELKKEIEKAEGLLKQTKKDHKDLADKCKVLYGDSWLRKKFNFTKKENAVFGDFTDEEKKKFTAEQKADFKKAKDDLKKTMDAEKMSLSNVAMETKDALARHEAEITRLENNLAKLKAAKEPVDTQVVKAEGRISKWEEQRKSFRIVDKVDGLVDEPVGEHVKVPGFKDAKEIKDNNDELFGKEVADFESKIKSPSALYGKASAFNFKVSGFETVSNPKKNTEVLLAIRKETDQVIFKLENTITKIKSTIDSGTIDAKDKPEAEKQIEALTNKIAELKTSIMDKIPLDSEGNIDPDVNQTEVLEEICPGILTISNDKVEVFGNELKTDAEKAEALETLQAAVAEIDALPDPVSRLKAYTETVAFGLDNKLRTDLDKDAINQIYDSIVQEKIPQLFRQIEDPQVAVKEGIDAIKILSGSGSSPLFSTEILQSITRGVAENIKSTEDPDSAYKAFVMFTEEFCKLDDGVIASAHPGSVEFLIGTNLGNTVIKKVRESESVFDASKKIADLAIVFAEKANGKITSPYQKRLLNIALSHLETANTSDVGLTMNEDGSTVSNEYQEALKYIQDKMTGLGLAHGEVVGTEKTKEEMLRRIEELSRIEDRSGLAQYATELAMENHPDEAMKAIDLAQLYCHGKPLELRLVAETFGMVEDEFYRNKTKEIYDSCFGAMRNASFMPAIAYIDLMQSMSKIDSNEQALEVADYVVDKIAETASLNDDISLNALNEFIKVADYFKDESTNKGIFDLSLKISKNLYETFSQNKQAKDKIVKLLGVMEENDLVDSAFELFSNQIEEVSPNEALEFIQYFDADTISASTFAGQHALKEESKNKYIDKIIKKIVAVSTSVVSVATPEATLVDVSPRVNNLVILYRELSYNGFSKNAENLFEENVDLENQENLVELVDMLSQDISNSDIQGRVDMYARKAIEISSDDFEGTLDLMSHWKDLDNNIYVEARNSARVIANGTFERLVKLAETMQAHDINLGLALTVEEAEQAAKVFLEKESTAEEGLEKLLKVADLYDTVKLSNEATRLREEVKSMTEQMYQDQGVSDEIPQDSDYFTQAEASSADSSQTSFGSTGGGVGATGGMGATAGAQPKKKGSAIGNFIRSLWGQ